MLHYALRLLRLVFEKRSSEPLNDFFACCTTPAALPHTNSPDYSNPSSSTLHATIWPTVCLFTHPRRPRPRRSHTLAVRPLHCPRRRRCLSIIARDRLPRSEVLEQHTAHLSRSATLSNASSRVVVSFFAILQLLNDTAATLWLDPCARYARMG